MQTSNALGEARAFAERNRIESLADYDALGMNPWIVYEDFKRRLALEVEPRSADWRLAVKLLSAILKI